MSHDSIFWNRQSVKADPAGKRFMQVIFFHVYPEDDTVGGDMEFPGSLSVYPYFKSRYILLNSIEKSFFALKYTGGRVFRPYFTTVFLGVISSTVGL